MNMTETKPDVSLDRESRSKDRESRSKDLEDPRIRRAGIIPYIKYNRQTFFLLGVSEIHAYISDFGGTRDHEDADLIETALREYNEETFGCLRSPTRGELESSKYIIDFTGYHGDEKCVIFFVPFPKDMPLFSKMLEFRHRSMPGDEIKGLIVLNARQLTTALRNGEERIDGTRIFFFHPKIKPILKRKIRTLLAL